MTLLNRAIAGDQDSWGMLTQLYAPLIKSRCRSAGIPEGDLEDLLQTVLVKLFQKLQQFQKQDGGSFRKWLRTVAAHCAMDYFRKVQREPKAVGGSDQMEALFELPEIVTDESLAMSLNPSSVQSPLKWALQRVQAEVTEEQWKIFILVKYEKQTSSAIAALLGKTPSAVRTTAMRVERKLKELVGDLPESATSNEE